MKRTWKSLLLCGCALSLMLMGGCDKDDKKSENNKTSSTQQEEKEVKVQLIENDRYTEPLEPTQPQIKAYNELSAAVEEGNAEEEAKQVAVSFVYDFFTLSNKKSSEDMGGLQFIPSDSIARFEEFARSYYYGNYATIVNEYSEDDLPEVTKVEVTGTEETQLTYNNSTNLGYYVSMKVTYADNDLPEEALKKDITVSVTNIDDFAYDREVDYGENPLVLPTETYANCWRVLAVE